MRLSEIVRETPFAAVPFTITVYVPTGVPGRTLLGTLDPPPQAIIPIVSANSSTPPDASLAQRATGGAVHAA